MPPRFTTFSAETVELEDWPVPDRIHPLAGNPEQRGMVLYRDPSKRVSYGIWEVKPGKFRAEFGPMAELADCVSGSATLTDVASGEQTLLEPGSRMIVPVGTVLTWDVHQTFRCVYSAYEDEWDENRYW
jgi:uncharacterized cupin superfamily protein